MTNPNGISTEKLADFLTKEEAFNSTKNKKSTLAKEDQEEGN